MNTKTQIIDLELIQAVCLKAKKSDRKRMNHNFHLLEDSVQRFLNAIEPDSYIRPHRHIEPLKEESFVILTGSGAVVIFEDNGRIAQIITIDPKNGTFGVDIPGGVFHTVLSLEPETVYFEVKKGPYLPLHDKCFPTWAPEESSFLAMDYLKTLKQNLETLD